MPRFERPDHAPLTGRATRRPLRRMPPAPAGALLACAVFAVVAPGAACKTRAFGEGGARAFENPAAVGRARTVFRYFGPARGAQPSTSASASAGSGAQATPGASNANAITSAGRGETPEPGEESCYLPKRFPGAFASPLDQRAEDALCRIDFDAHALCPGVSGDIPVVDVFPLGGLSKEVFERDACAAAVRPTRPVARFGVSISCAWTGSVLGYAHIARALGASTPLVGVPTAVLRTMDARRFAEVTARSLPRSGFAGSLWQRLHTTATEASLVAAFPSSSSSSSRALSGTQDSLLTPDGRSVYGSLTLVPEAPSMRADAEFASLPLSCDARYKDALFRTPSFARLSDAAPLGPTLPTSFAAAAPVLQKLDDLANGVLLDFLFQQKGRAVGGLVRDEWIARTPEGAFQRAPVDPASPDALPWRSAIKVARLPLESNECGSRPGSEASFAAADLARLAHFNPDTYARLRSLAADPERLRFLDDEALLSTQPTPGRDGGFEGFRSRVVEAARLLESRCRAKTLVLDLSLEDHARGPGAAAKPGERCDAILAWTADGLRAEIAGATTSSASASGASSQWNTPREGRGGSSETGGSSPDSTLQDGAPTSSSVSSAGAAGASERTAGAGGVPDTCTVLAERANARARAHPSADVVAQFEKGTTFAVGGRKGGWYKVVLDDGKSAYVNYKALEKPCGAR